MSDITIFKNDELNVELRTILLDGVEWFIAKDVADCLGYSQTADMTKRLDEDDVKTIPDKLSGLTYNQTIINESGLYAAILGSNKPMAKKFKRWVTSEVLPSIRKTGGYNIPSNYIDALKQLVQSEEEKQRIQLERDEAIRLKAMVASGREGTLFSKTGVLTKQVNKLGKIVYELEIENEELYDENERFKSQDKTIRGFASLHHIDLDINECKIYGKELSRICREKNVEIHSVLFSGEKYPTNVYPHYELVKFFIKQGHDLNL